MRRELQGEIVAGVLTLVSVVLLALPASRQASFARALNHVLLLPFAGPRAALSGYVGLRGENARLRQELQRARLDLARVAVERAENRRLRQLLAFREDREATLLPARVIDRDFETIPTTFLIDVGRRDGVVQNLPVVTERGLVGKTFDVGPGATLVMLYNHPDFSASALLLGRGHLEYGVVRPGQAGELNLFLPLRSTSERGDRIVTSGYGGTFPRGIPMGTVAEVREDRRLGLQRIDVVEPVVDLGAATAVFVLRRSPGPTPGQAAGDELRLFWPGFASPPMSGEPLRSASAAGADSAAEAESGIEERR